VYVNQTNLNGKLRKKLEPSKNLGVAWPAQSPPLEFPWSRSKSLQPITNLVQITNYTSPNYTDRPQVNINYWTFFHRSRFLNNLSLPWKKRIALKFSLYWIYFLHLGFLTACTCPENRVSLKFFAVLNIFFTIQDFWEVRLPWKTELPSSLYWIHFLHSGVSSNLRLPWKTELPGNFHCMEYTFCIQNLSN